MFEALKKTLFAGLGATVITGERLRAKLDELVDKGRISAREAEEMADKIMAEGRKEFDEGSTRISNMLDDMLRRANFARQKDLDALSDRVARLEAGAAGRSMPGGAGIPPQPSLPPPTVPPQPMGAGVPPRPPTVDPKPGPDAPPAGI